MSDNNLGDEDNRPSDRSSLRTSKPKNPKLNTNSSNCDENESNLDKQRLSLPNQSTSLENILEEKKVMDSTTY